MKGSYGFPHEVSAFIYTSVQPRAYARVQLKIIIIIQFKL